MFLSNEKAKQNEGIKEKIEEIEARTRKLMHVPESLSQ